jgi:RNA polymerase sigma factor (sigma-70 family)
VVKTVTEPGSAELERLVRAAQGGQPRAFDRLADALLPRLRRWAVAHVSSPDEADDIAQEVLLKTHRALGEFAFGSRITTWLYAVTRRTAADWHRKRHRREQLMAEHSPGPAVEPYSGPSLDTAALTELVQQAFRKLPNRQREVFDLADLQGIPLTEIAEMLGMSPITARVHLHRARTSIRTRILQSHPALVEDL